MPIDRRGNVEDILQLADTVQQKRNELDELQALLRHELSKSKHKPIVRAIVSQASPKGSANAHDIFDAYWTRIERVFQSGTFYFFAGFGLLLYAIHASNAKEHPSLTFLLAMLGFAIMLFGTGSKAVGAIATAGERLPHPGEISASSREPAQEAHDDHARASVAEAQKRAGAALDAVEEGLSKPTDTDKAAALAGLVPLVRAAAAATSEIQPSARKPDRRADWTPIKANAVIAGGAAVLTAVFALGVILFSERIRYVFNDFERYEHVVVEACSLDGGQNFLCAAGQDLNSKLNLDNYRIRIENAQGDAIPFFKKSQSIHITVFRDNLRAGAFLRLTASSIGDERLYTERIDVRIPLLAQAKDAKGQPACAMNEQSNECRLSRISQPENDKGRVTIYYFSLNFAPQQRVPFI